MATEDPNRGRRPTSAEKNQEKIDGIVGMLGSARGMWLLGGLGVLGVVALVMVIVDQFGH